MGQRKTVPTIGRRLDGSAAEADVSTDQIGTSARSGLRAWLIPLLAAAATLAFLLATPPGVLSKAKMVGYAVCHQIASHSFTFAGLQLPLCARCTGTFAGAVVGLLGQVVVLRRSRAGAFPPPLVLGVCALFLIFLGVDGLNSYLTFFPSLPHLYEPANWLRLTTGTLYGLAMSAIIYPVLSFTLLREPGAQPAVGSICDLAILVALGAALIGTVLTGWSGLLYPLALLSAIGVLGLLTCVNTVLVVILAHKENTSDTWRDAVPALLAGLTLSVIQIGSIGIVRFWLTGTLDGIPFLG
jgi:uncharacterized membrane protein